MADTRFGLFMPGESETLSKASVLRSSVLGRTEPTPTIPDPRYSVLAPEADVLHHYGDSDSELAVMMSDRATVEFPTERPILSDEIKNALRTGNMTVTLACESGAMSSNCDRGYADFQDQQSAGLYNDYQTKATALFHLNDPRPSSFTDDQYQGKCKPPVADWWDTACFYRSYSGTKFSENFVFFPRIYSDGDFVYAVAIIKDTGLFFAGDIAFFVFDPYTRRFILRSKVNTPDAQIILNPTCSPWFAGVCNTKTIPCSPSICRVKDHDNKLLCTYLAHTANDPDNLYIAVAESQDDGVTWSELATFGTDGFTEYLVDLDNLMEDFRLRIASNGTDVLIVWGAYYSVFASKSQIRWMRSRDGGATWEYGTNNLLPMFVAHMSTWDCVTGVSTDYSIKFDLTTDQEGRFILASRGNGLVENPLNNPPIDSGEPASFEMGNRFLIVWYTESGKVLEWTLGGKICPSWDYVSAIDGYYKGREIMDVALCSDSIHGWEYAMIKVYAHTTSPPDAADTGWQADYFTSIVRFKFMPTQFWSVYPDWVGTGTGNYRALESAFIMEPPNRNTAAFHTCNLLGAGQSFMRSMSLVEHRGHLLAVGVVEEDGYVDSGKFNVMVCFKAWSNAPINYGVRQNYLPICDDPTNQGWTAAAVDAQIANATDRDENEIEFSTVVANLVGGNTEYFSVTSTNVEAYPLGYQESVLRFTVKIGPMSAGGEIQILDCESPIWSTALGTQRYAKLRVSYKLNSLVFYTDAGVARLVDLLSEDTWYEYMVVRVGYDIAIYRREFNDDTKSSIVGLWELKYTTNASGDVGAAPAPRSSTIKFGCITSTAGNFYSGSWWKFKNIQTSRSYTDTLPQSMHYLQDTQHYLANQNVGMLTSQRDFPLAYPTGDKIYQGIRGEFISPHPIWIGNEWLAVVDSPLASKALLWLTMKETLDAPLRVTPNIGSVGGLVTVGDGVTVNTFPAQASPIGMSFDGINDYLNVGNDTIYDLTTRLTIAAWVYPTTADNGYILAKNSIAGNTGYSLYWSQAAGSRVYLFGDPGGSVWSDAVFTERYEWVHVAVVINNTSVTFYKNGQKINTVSTLTGLVTNTEYVQIGRGNTGSYLKASLTKVGLFNYSLSTKEVRELYLEGPYGPAIPSDAYLMFYGHQHSTENAWTLVAKDYGGGADNVLNNNLSSTFYSNRDGAGGIAPGGAAYNGGDVEVVIYTRNETNDASEGFITANAAFFDAVNATDVAIYAQDAAPDAAGWGGAVLIGTAQFHHRDDDEGLPLNVHYSAAGGIVDGVVTGAGWRDGVYANERMLVCMDSNPDHYDVAADATKNRIVKVVYNTDTRIQFDDDTLTSGAVDTWVRQLANRLMIRFTEATYRYWRFVFTNNATNGEKIKVGTIKLGSYLEFDLNPDMGLKTTLSGTNDRESGVLGTVHQIALGDIKREFNLSFDMTDSLGDSSDFNKLRQAYAYSMQTGSPIFLVTGMYDDQDFTTLVYSCMTAQDFDAKQEQFPGRSVSLTLEEM